MIERDGKPIAKLVAPGLIVSNSGKRVLGGLRGQLKVPEDFDDMYSEEIQALFVRTRCGFSLIRKFCFGHWTDRDGCTRGSTA